MTQTIFVFGVLQHEQLLAAILGRSFEDRPETVRGLSGLVSDDYGQPSIFEQAAGCLVGRLLDVADREFAILKHCSECFGGECREVTLGTGQKVDAFLPAMTVDFAEMKAWDYLAWAESYGAEYSSLARRFASEPKSAQARLPQMLVREGAAVRAKACAPTKVRHKAKADDVLTNSLRQPYARFFAVEEADLSFRRFDGSMSPQVTRAAFICCDAVTVLPYDAVRDRVLVIDQFRAGPHLRGDPQPWQIEAIAGRIDAGETPENAARREAAEEAGLTLTDLIDVGRYYPSPGAVTEYIYSYVALVDLPDVIAGVFGVEGEAEDIRGHLLSFTQLMEAVASGEISNAPLLLTAYWLASRRKDLRGA